MLISEVVDKFMTLNISEFEKWCRNNNLITDAEEYSTHRRFYILLTTDDEQEDEYVVTIRHHLRRYNALHKKILLEPVNPNYNKSIYESYGEDIENPDEPIIIITQGKYDDHLVFNDPRSSYYGV